VDGDRHPDACIGAGQLLEYEDVGEEVGSRAAVLLRHADAHQPQLRQLHIEVPREVVVAIPLRGVRPDLGVREVASERLDLSLVVAESELHGASIGATRRSEMLFCR
jgi:hypothetical protein